MLEELNLLRDWFSKALETRACSEVVQSFLPNQTLEEDQTSQTNM